METAVFFKPLQYAYESCIIELANTPILLVILQNILMVTHHHQGKLVGVGVGVGVGVVGVVVVKGARPSYR